MTTTTKKTSRRGRAPKYPWIGMRPGDSFFVPAGELPAGGSLGLYTCGLQWARSCPERRGTKFVTYDVPDGVRVWCRARPTSAIVEPTPDSVAYKVEAEIPVPELSDAERQARSVLNVIRQRRLKSDPKLLPPLHLETLEVGESTIVYKEHDWNRRRYLDALRCAVDQWQQEHPSREPMRFDIREAFGGYCVERVA